MSNVFFLESNEETLKICSECILGKCTILARIVGNLANVSLMTLLAFSGPLYQWTAVACAYSKKRFLLTLEFQNTDILYNTAKHI